MTHLHNDEIYTFKLNSGEEITAKIVNSTTETIEIRQPISMVLGSQGLQMMPSLFSSNPDKNTHINTSAIAMVAETREDVKSKYIEATTGITTPASRQIITG
jgi:hypothetical protein